VGAESTQLKAARRVALHTIPATRHAARLAAGPLQGRRRGVLGLTRRPFGRHD
jgi:hypothetical protein